MALEKNEVFDLIYTNDRARDDLFKEIFSDVEERIIKTLNIPDAYFKVGKIEGTKDKIVFDLYCYKDSTKKYLVKTKKYDFIPSVDVGSENFVKQAYEYLKTLDNYRDAADV